MIEKHWCFFRQLDLCKQAVIDAENRPAFINLITSEPQMRVRITSSYHRGINISKLIRIYTKFDERVLALLRLFRILAKVRLEKNLSLLSDSNTSRYVISINPISALFIPLLSI